MSRLFSLGLVVSALAAIAAATAGAPTPSSSSTTADWPCFRGPKRDNLSPDKGLLKSWPKTGPKLLWTAKGIGQGFSSVAVAGNRIFTMGDKKGSSHVFAISKDKGDILWSHKVGRAGGNYAGTRCTPTVDGDLVYGLGQFGDLVCLRVSDGAEKWRKSLEKDFGGQSGGWNYTESPLIDGDRLICTPGGSKATMVALNKKTGTIIWRAPLRQTAGYSSIVISNAANVKQYVQLTSAGTIGIAAKDGKLLWHYEKFSGNTANVPTPIVLGDQIFTAAGYGQGGALLTLSSNGAGVKFKQEYLKNELQNKHGGVLIAGDCVYSDTDDSGNFHCAEWKTGKVKWTRNNGGKTERKAGGSASVTWADGMLYIFYQNGWVELVPATPDSYVAKGSFKVPAIRGYSWAHPVVIGGCLYLRQDDNLFCYDVKAK